MSRTLRILLASGLLTGVAVFASNATADQPGWSPVVIARGEYRQQLQATPIEYRPNRPLHVYGNTVRRRYHQGTYLPAPRQIVPFFIYRGR